MKGQRECKFSFPQIDAGAKIGVLSFLGKEVRSQSDLKEEWGRLRSSLTESTVPFWLPGKAETKRAGWLDIRDLLEDERDRVVGSAKVRRELVKSFGWLRNLSELELAHKKEEKMRKIGNKKVEAKVVKKNGSKDGASIEQLLSQGAKEAVSSQTKEKAVAPEKKDGGNGKSAKPQVKVSSPNRVEKKGNETIEYFKNWDDRGPRYSQLHEQGFTLKREMIKGEYVIRVSGKAAAATPTAEKVHASK